MAGATASSDAADAPARPSPLTKLAPFGAHSRIQGVNNAFVSVSSPISTPMWSLAVAVKVQVSRSPVEMVPVAVAPLVRGPPSSPADMVTGPGVWVSVS